VTRSDPTHKAKAKAKAKAVEAEVIGVEQRGQLGQLQLLGISWSSKNVVRLETASADLTNSI